MIPRESIRNQNLKIGDLSFKTNLFIIDTIGFDIILGMDLLEEMMQQ